MRPVFEAQFLKIINVLGAARKPPIHPENLAAILRSDKVKFTCGSDVELVIEKYRLFCEEVAGGVVILDFEATPTQVGSWRTRCDDPVEWSEDDMHLFSQAIVLFSKCQMVKLGGHALTKETAAILTDALVRMPALKLVDFSLWAAPSSRWFDNDVEALLRNRLCEAPGGSKCVFVGMPGADNLTRLVGRNGGRQLLDERHTSRVQKSTGF